MHTIKKEIIVNAPVTAVYNQWTQFEEFPRFMDGVESVKQLDATHLHWRAKIAGKEKEWDAEIFDQVPDQSIAWRSLSGARNEGVVLFTPAPEGGTIITLQITLEPEGTLEKFGDALGLVSSRIEGDLKRFKKFIEDRQTETGGWRGAVEHGRVQGNPTESKRRIKTTPTSASTEPRSKRIFEE